jgi:hypothetical protein
LECNKEEIVIRKKGAKGCESNRTVGGLFHRQHRTAPTHSNKKGELCPPLWRQKVSPPKNVADKRSVSKRALPHFSFLLPGSSLQIGGRKST